MQLECSSYANAGLCSSAVVYPRPRGRHGRGVPCRCHCCPQRITFPEPFRAAAGKRSLQATWDVSVGPEPCAQTLAAVSGCESLSQVTRPEDTEHVLEEQELDTVFVSVKPLLCIYHTKVNKKQSLHISVDFQS